MQVYCRPKIFSFPVGAMGIGGAYPFFCQLKVPLGVAFLKWGSDSSCQSAVDRHSDHHPDYREHATELRPRNHVSVPAQRSGVQTTADQPRKVGKQQDGTSTKRGEVAIAWFLICLVNVSHQCIVLTYSMYCSCWLAHCRWVSRSTCWLADILYIYSINAARIGAAFG